MKILIITHGYAPALNARAFRWTALAEHWAARGHLVDVVTVRSGGSDAETAGAGVRVHRVGFYLDRLGVYARHAAHGAGTIDSVRHSSIRQKLGRAAIRVVKKIYDLTWKKLYWPDYAMPWIPFAAIAARGIIARGRPDVVISVSLPFSSHVAALLAGVSRRNLPWLVDVGDPFSFMTSTPTNNHALYSRLNEWAERAVVRRAAIVAVTNEPTGAMYGELFGHAEKVRVIPPMLSGSLVHSGEPSVTELEDRLVYIGTLNRVIRSPDRLLEIFDALVRQGSHPGLELHFFGESGDCTASFEGLAPSTAARVKVHGLVGREDAMRAVRSARAVVNIGNATSFQVPSKLVEYAASGRPIVNLSAGSADLSVGFLSGIPKVLTLQGEKGPVEEAGMLSEFLTRVQNSPADSASIQWLSKFSVEAIADLYVKPINETRAAGDR